MSRKKGKQSKGGWSRFLTTEAAASFRGSRGHLRYFAPTEERERYSLQQRRPLGGGGGGGGGMCRIKVNPADLWTKLPPARRVGKLEGNGSASRNRPKHCDVRLREFGTIAVPRAITKPSGNRCKGLVSVRRLVLKRQGIELCGVPLGS